MSHTTLNWERTLADAGLRVTRQRELVLDSLCAAGGHTPIGEIYLRAQKVDPKLDLSTVYRSLHVFVHLGIVVPAPGQDGELHYEIRHSEPHHHLICRKCGVETSISGELVLSMADAIMSKYGFALESDHLILNGTCANCQARNDAELGQSPGRDNPGSPSQ